MASGFPPVVRTRAMVSSDRRSKIVTDWSRPLLVAPRPRSGASATPCTPGVLGISPRTSPESASITTTRVPGGRDGGRDDRNGDAHEPAWHDRVPGEV